VFARYPLYRARSNQVETIEYRVNDCFRRSMNGTPLAVDGSDMRDIVAYLAFLSRDVPVGTPPSGDRSARWAGLTPDSAAGGALYRTTCSQCHGPDGEGGGGAPPLWGPASYNVGAGMARVRSAAAFIAANMPFDRPGSLSDQQALNLAAYVDGHPRPDFPDKIHDWPNGDPPPDVAYQTLGVQRKAKPPR
jgi:thiosulfate dehydrogenase